MSQVAIVGAGIGGLAAAHTLGAAGHDVTVFESGGQARSGGGALILWCNAMKALGAMGLADALRSQPSLQVVEHSEFRRETGTYLTNMPVGEISRRHEGLTVVVAREDLHATLWGAAVRVARLRMDDAVTRVELGDDDAHVVLADGRRARFDAVLGADGLRSTVRASLGLDPRVNELDQDLWVATTRHTPPGLDPGDTVATLGEGLRFWHARLGDDRTFWYATLRTDDGRAPVTDLAGLAARFADWHDPIPALIAHTVEGDWIRTPLRDRDPSKTWGRGCVSLLGDAAHAMTPDLGQGACQALEDAVVLARRFDPDDVPAGLRRYERDRLQRTADLARMSRLVAETSSPDDPATCAVRDAAMRFGLRATATTQLGWIFQGV